MWIAGVLLGRSIISPAMFDLELEWTVGLGDGGKGERTPARGGC